MSAQRELHNLFVTIILRKSWALRQSRENTRGRAGPTGVRCQHGRHFALGVRLLLTILAVGAGVGVAVGQTDDPAQSLTFGEIEILTSDIFTTAEIDSSTGLLHFLFRTTNSLHIDTHHYVIRRELLFAEGDRYDPALLAETERNLRQIGYLRGVSVAAADTTADGRVNVYVHTRDTWSLKLNFSYTVASDRSKRWYLTLSDTNFLGHGVTFGAGLGEDENGTFTTFDFHSRRLFGSRWELGVIYSNRSDGYVKSVRLDRPFYALDQSWGGNGTWLSTLTSPRYYLSNAGPAGDDPSRRESLYTRFPQALDVVELSVGFRISSATHGRLVRVGPGLRWQERRFDLVPPVRELSDERWVDLSYLTEEGTPIAREQGTTVWPYLWLESSGRDYVKSNYLFQYGPTEDVPLGWAANLAIGPAGPAMGSTAGSDERVHFEAKFSDWSRTVGGHQLLRLTTAGNLGGPADRYYRIDALAGWITWYGPYDTPWLTRVFAEVGWGENLLGSEAMVLGLDRGLRTLGFDGMAGDRLARWNLEQGRVLPIDLFGFMTVGVAAFYNGGAAWYQDEARDLGDARHEAGCGIRLGAKRSGTADTLRLDVTWPLEISGSPVLTAVTRGVF